jgi:hypothetical protein
MPKDKKIQLDPMEWRDAMKDIASKAPAPGKKKAPAKKSKKG